MTVSDEPHAEPSATDPIDLAILDAARACVAEFGVRRTTLTEVARRAGVSRPTVYRRWPDTGSLVAELLVRELGDILTTAMPTDGVVRQRMVDGIVAGAAAVRTNPLFRKIFRADTDLMLTYVFGRLGRNQRHLIELFAEGIRKATPTARSATATPSRWPPCCCSSRNRWCSRRRRSPGCSTAPHWTPNWAASSTAISFRTRPTTRTAMTQHPASTGDSALNAARRDRELAELGDTAEIDLLVIGGGVTGTGVALDAASRGLRTVLVERHDLAFGTSRWSSKLVHGGLRYLAGGHIGIAHECGGARHPDPHHRASSGAPDPAAGAAAAHPRQGAELAGPRRIPGR